MKRFLKHFTLLTVLVALFAALAATANAAESDPVDLSLVFSPETQLTVYVDGEWSGALSDTFGYGESVSLAAPTVSGKTFSHWEADGSIISYANSLKLTMNAHTTLYAVYASAAPTAKPVAGFTSITRTNDGESIVLQAKASGETAGFVYSTTVTGSNLKIGGTDVTDVAAVKLTDEITEIPKSALDDNNCYMLKITPTDADTVYHVRAYVTSGGETTYGDVKDVKLTELPDGISMIANLEGFWPDTDDELAKLANGMHTVTYDANGGVGAIITQGFLGDSVTLRTNTFTREGYTFSGWSTNQNGGGTTYTDGQSVTLTADTTLYAQWTENNRPEPETFIVTFDANGGNVSPNKAVTGTDGKLASLPTPPRTGSYSFLGWYDTASGGTKVTTSTVFTKDTTIYAHWNYTGGGSGGNGGGNSSGGGGGGNSGTPATTTVTVPVSGEDASVNVTVSVRGDTATIGSADVDKVLNAEDVGTVTIDVSALQQNVAEVIIPGAMMEKIADAVASESSDANGLEVKLPTGSVTFDSEAVAAIAEQTGGKDLAVNLDGIKVTDLASAQQEAVKELEVVLDAYLTVGGQRISDFKGGSATVKIPYTLKDGQTAQGLVVWYVANDGTKTQVPATYDGKNVVFTVPHFSNYVIAYDAEKAAACPQDDTCPISAFTDADPKAWYHDGVHYVLDNGIMNGTGGGKFEPGATATRAMIVTMLWRMEGEPGADYAMTFADVESGAWYAGAVRWAASNGIVSGYSDAAFGPNDSITREQLAAIFYRYAQSKGQGFTGAWMFLLDYPDAADVSEWADEAMHWMVMNELIQGMDGLLNPKGEATRAQIATILMRYEALT